VNTYSTRRYSHLRSHMERNVSRDVYIWTDGYRCILLYMKGSPNGRYSYLRECMERGGVVLRVVVCGVVLVVSCVVVVLFLSCHVLCCSCVFVWVTCFSSCLERNGSRDMYKQALVSL